MPMNNMAEIFHLEGSDCIGAHELDRYTDPNALHNRHDLKHGFRQNMRIHLTPRELEVLAQEGRLNVQAIRYGNEQFIGVYSVQGCNGQLDGERIVLDGDDSILVSGKLCEELRQKKYVETTTPLADISVLVVSD